MATKPRERQSAGLQHAIMRGPCIPSCWRQKVKRLTGLVRNALVYESGAVQHVEMSGLVSVSVAFETSQFCSCALI